VLRWWRGPLWILQLITGAKSFVDNPILGSRKLNESGLHLWRVQTAHRLAQRRRRRLAHLISPELRKRFDQDGYVCIENFLAPDQFEQLRSAVLDAEADARAHQQGDTITRRVPVGPELRRAIPELDRLLDRPEWTGLLAYVASTRTTPLYYVQTILGGVAAGPPDPQIELHSDTFHPSLKAWLFLTDVDEAGRPLTYVPGSHLLTPERLAWEKRKSVEVLEHGDRLSQRGSFRVSDAELKELGLGPPVRFAVPANTLVAVDTCGFHARAESDRPTLRVELWAYCRRTPFIPWTGGDPLSLRPLAGRRAQWLAAAVDWLDERGLMQQHWRQAGRKRPRDP
jgi:hypothetical protein